MTARPDAPGPLPRLGVLDFHPIQYHSPLYQRLTSRGQVDLDVLFLSDYGYRGVVDPEFGVTVAWDIDLLSGFTHHFLAENGQLAKNARRARAVSEWIRSHDVVVIHGYSHPWMLFAMAACRRHGVPYLMRGDSGPPGKSTGLRLKLRNVLVRMAVTSSAAGLSIGQLNEAFYRKYGAPKIVFAPYSVDDERFARTPEIGRPDLLAHYGLDGRRPVIMFCGKLYPGKRPLDLAEAIKLLPCEVTTLFVGDGVLAEEVRGALRPGAGTVTGFVNQSELPAYYHAADILVLPSQAEKWGLVVNEAMAAGVLPVVSDRIGAAPDLVSGVGEVYSCGDIPGLASALSRALVRINDPESRNRMRQHAARFSLDRTAAGFEQAALMVSGQAADHSNLATASGA